MLSNDTLIFVAALLPVLIALYFIYRKDKNNPEPTWQVQYKKLRACSLYDYFDNVILSEDAGANKPSRKFFDYAFEKTGAKVETTLMIGDNYNADIEGAMDYGLDTILFNRWDPDFVPPRKPTHIVKELMEIKDYINNL